MKILIDLNVLLDVFQKREPHYRASAAVCHHGVLGRYALYIPAHAFTTIYYIIRKCADRSVADNALGGLRENIEVTELTKKVLEEGSRLAFDDFEDSLVAASAQNCGCDYIVTRNVADFNASPVPALTPAKFLNTFAQGRFT
jgi:predicted nucleic acid-binding protein